MIRKIFTIGKYSKVVSIPGEILRSLGWRSGQKVVVSKERGKIQIKDFKNK